MKRIILHLSFWSLLFLSGCGEDGIVDSKPGEPIDPVTNLEYSVADSDGEVTLTWELPSSFPENIIQPVSIHVRVKTDGITASTQVLENAPESYIHSSYDSSKEYRFTVKVMGSVDTSEPHISNLRYSPGKTVVLE